MNMADMAAKTAVIDVGGGMRGIYAAGALDTCIGAGVHFKLALGVSAGAANLASFLAGQKGRNFVFYTKYALRLRYMSVFNYILSRNYINLDYAYGTLSRAGGEFPLDYAALNANPAEFFSVVTNALTGEAVYYSKARLAQDNYDILKASGNLPVINRPYMLDGIPCYDGALSDPVPLEKALSLGCERVVLILTKPRAFRRDPNKDEGVAERLQKLYPLAAEGLRLRACRYNAALDRAEELAAEGRVLIVAPDDTCGVDTVTRNRQNMVRLYNKGLADGREIVRFMEGAL